LSERVLVRRANLTQRQKASFREDDLSGLGHNQLDNAELVLHFALTIAHM
jgi:hypothetical protein